MRDANGLYYYPNPSEPRSRVYVRQGDEGIEFRLWHADHPAVWEKHGWLPLAAIEQAAAAYKERNSGANPLLLYDAAVAQALISGK